MDGLSSEDIRQLKEAFFAQSSELLDSLGTSLLKLEQTPHDAGILLEIQRIVHTLKGDSKAVGLTPLGDLAHRLEDLLVSLSEENRPADKAMVGLLFRCADAFQQMLQQNRDGAEISIDGSELSAELDQCGLSAGRKPSGSGPLSEYARVQIQRAGREGRFVFDITLNFDARCQERLAGSLLVHRRLSDIGEVVFSDPSPESDALNESDHWRLLLITSKEAKQVERAGRFPGVIRQATAKPLENADGFREKRTCVDRRVSFLGTPDQILRVDSRRVDEMMNLVGELIISRSAVNRLSSDLEERYDKDEAVNRLIAATMGMERTLSDLQKSVMKIRMVQIDQVFRRFPRIIRDLTQEMGKEVGLEITGKETELDKSLVDVIGEPLLHLVRNAIDHGIESAEIRAERGKPTAGTIALRACHESNQIVIEVGDDGGGIDRGKLKRKAVEKGLITGKDAERLTDMEALDLIFYPGLSTADRVTDVSGRGIGMDVVKNTVEKLKGLIEVATEPGKGTKFSLRLPLTLAIIKAMMFEVGHRRYALPMSSIVEIARSSSKLGTVHGKPVFHHRGRVISLINLGNLFSVGDPPPDNRRCFIIIVGIAEKRVGLIVDELVGEEELVIKPLDDQWVPSKSVAGASILGDGRIALILDAPTLVHEAVGRERDLTAAGRGERT